MKANWDFQLYPPSILAAACIVSSRMACNIIPCWNEKLQELTGYDYFNDVKGCFERLYLLYDENFKPVRD